MSLVFKAYNYILENMSQSAREFYQGVIDEVIESMRNEFVSEGVSEDILEKLKKTWEQKL